MPNENEQSPGRMQEAYQATYERLEWMQKGLGDISGHVNLGIAALTGMMTIQNIGEADGSLASHVFDIGIVAVYIKASMSYFKYVRNRRQTERE